MTLSHTSAALLFVSVVIALLTLTRLLHLFNQLFQHRQECAARNRGVSPGHANINDPAMATFNALASDNVMAGHNRRPHRTLVILGSGGHTGEMLCLLQHIDRKQCRPLIYVRAITDISSEVRIRELEHSHSNDDQVQYVTIPRSREVGQSYLTSVATTLWAIAHSVLVVYRTHPEVVLCNGPGTCLPIVAATWVFKLLLFRPCRVIFIESFCRVQSLSLCGRLLYVLVDRFIVQWPRLTRKFPLTEYLGRLC